MRALRFEASEHFDVSPSELWPLVSDTARLNRSIGLKAVHFTAIPREDGGSTVIGEFRRFGMTVARWKEHAFNFVRPQRYSVLREYTNGPLVRLDGGVDLTPDRGGTRVHVWGEVVPRNLLGVVLSHRIVGPAATSLVLAQCRLFEEVITGKRADPFPQLSTHIDVDQRHLDELIGRLNAVGGDASITQRLRERLATVSDERVVKMRAFEVADEWGTDRFETLIVFLRATTVGLLRMMWDVLCPNCRVPKAEFANLSQVDTQAHCDVCNIMFDTNFERLVEVGLSVAPSVREAHADLYCIGGPQNTPHVVAQTELGPGDTAYFPIPDGLNVVRLRSPQVPSTALIDTKARTIERNVELYLQREGIEPPTAEVASMGASVTVENHTGALAVVQLEERFWPTTATTAALLGTLQEFRDLFAADVLAPGLEVGIERLAFLFTDIAGSTRMYEEVGQARAFRIVQDHFRLILGAVRESRGALVKTIGDAVMAVFPTAAQAVDAAFAMQRAMRELDTRDVVNPRRFLKVGIHIGPCLAVTLNDHLDYFGTTVNMAARVEHEAAGGQIVITHETYVEPGVAEIVQTRCSSTNACDVQLRGISTPTPIVVIEADENPGD